MKHIKLFEQFISEINEGKAAFMLSKLGKGTEYETVASMMSQDEEVSKEIMNAMKKLNCAPEECGVIGDYHTDDWNKVLKTAKASGIKFIEIEDDNGSAIVFNISESSLNEGKKGEKLTALFTKETGIELGDIVKQEGRSGKFEVTRIWAPGDTGGMNPGLHIELTQISGGRSFGHFMAMDDNGKLSDNAKRIKKV